MPEPKVRARQFPHELSGGLRQRVTIALALSCDPAVLLADEPTTAIDVTISAQILDLLAQMQAERSMGVVLVSHDLGVIASRTDVLCVMYAGRIVEMATTPETFASPSHPYTGRADGVHPKEVPRTPCLPGGNTRIPPRPRQLARGLSICPEMCPCSSPLFSRAAAAQHDRARSPGRMLLPPQAADPGAPSVRSSSKEGASMT